MSEIDKAHRCENCGLAWDNGNDAMCWCRRFKMRVVKGSLACSWWCDEEVF